MISTSRFTCHAVANEEYVRRARLVAESVGFTHGSRFAHIKYDFGSGGAAVTRNFFQTINHALFNPVLPFDTNVSGTIATVYGNGYRLSNLESEKTAIDKTFSQLQVEK